MSDVGLVVAAAGSSSRFGPERNKLLEDFRGLPLFCHCLRNLTSVVPAENVCLAVSAQQRDVFAAALQKSGLPLDERHLLNGGESRSATVSRCLQHLPQHVQLAAIQDAARPFTTAALLESCVDSARRTGSGVAARRVTDTIKQAQADGRVLNTLDRNTLWATETPQVFNLELIRDAYDRVLTRGSTVTDDAQAAEIAGHDVYLVEHETTNIKITYTTDLERYT